VHTLSTRNSKGRYDDGQRPLRKKETVRWFNFAFDPAVEEIIIDENDSFNAEVSVEQGPGSLRITSPVFLSKPPTK
jgi:hypothetical protein